MSVNGLFQLFSPIILFPVLLKLFLNDLFWVIMVITIIIIITNIIYNCFFDNDDNIFLEIGRFSNYFILVIFTAVSIISLVDISSGFANEIIIVFILVFSLHLRLIKFNVYSKKFFYNALINRDRYHTSSNTISYPRISTFSLFRIELYILLLFIGKTVSISVNGVTTDPFNVIFISILLDVAIYLLLAKNTKLLTSTN